MKEKSYNTTDIWMPHFSHKAHDRRYKWIFFRNMAVNLEIAILEATVIRTTQFEDEVIHLWRLVQNFDIKLSILCMRFFYSQTYSLQSTNLFNQSRMHHYEQIYSGKFFMTVFPFCSRGMWFVCFPIKHRDNANNTMIQDSRK